MPWEELGSPAFEALCRLKTAIEFELIRTELRPVGNQVVFTSVVGYGIAAIAVTAMYVSVFPSFQDQMAGYAEAMPEGMAEHMREMMREPVRPPGHRPFTGRGGPFLAAATGRARPWRRPPEAGRS